MESRIWLFWLILLFALMDSHCQELTAMERLTEVESILFRLAARLNRLELRMGENVEGGPQLTDTVEQVSELEQKVNNLEQKINQQALKQSEIERYVGNFQNYISMEKRARLAAEKAVEEISGNEANRSQIFNNISKDLRAARKTYIRMSSEMDNKTTDLTEKMEELRNRKGKKFIKDCSDVTGTESGVYTIYIEGVAEPVSVYCDLTTDNGSWTVFQRRQDGSVDFYRDWHDYEVGFGNLSGEFWLGNHYIHSITDQGDYELRIDLEDFDGEKRYARYSKFSVADAASKYKLEVSGYSGDAGDSLTYHGGRPFTTFDNDNDIGAGNCAISYTGAWWYGACHYSNLNGQYLGGAHKTNADGVNWYHWRGSDYSLKYTQMAVRRRDRKE